LNDSYFDLDNTPDRSEWVSPEHPIPYAFPHLLMMSRAGSVRTPSASKSIVVCDLFAVGQLVFSRLSASVASGHCWELVKCSSESDWQYESSFLPLPVGESCCLNRLVPPCNHFASAASWCSTSHWQKRPRRSTIFGEERRPFDLTDMSKDQQHAVHDADRGRRNFRRICATPQFQEFRNSKS